jgi:hypothetical protein
LPDSQGTRTRVPFAWYSDFATVLRKTFEIALILEKNTELPQSGLNSGEKIRYSEA